MDKKFIDKFENLKNVPSSDNQLKQQRGRDFECLINDILQAEGISLKKSYHTKDNRSEQIDGAIEINNRILLVETKWVESNLAASDLFSFIGKIENKFFGTLGVFFSKEELSENFINALNKGRRQTVVVIHGQDIEELFNPKNSFGLKEYIGYCIRVCSYDNILHFPVRKYLEIQEEDEPIEKSIESDASVAFIKDALIKSVSEEELLLKIEENNQEINDAVFEKIILKYSDFYRLNLKKLDFTIITNFNNFLKLTNIKDEVEKSIAKTYYQDLLSKDIEIYSRDIFLEFFSKYYGTLNSEERINTEKILLDKLKLAISNSNWNQENYITDVISPVWKHIELIDDFKDCYIEIFLRDTLDKFSQKKFANELVNNNEIGKESAKKWLIRKIENIKNDEDFIPDESTVRFIAVTYSKLNKIIREDDWISYVSQLIKEIYGN